MSQSRRSALKGLSIIPFFPKCPERSISPAHIPRRLQSTSPSHGPLRILFCGSDHFSATSLKALYGEYAAQTGLIESIDVLCRADKRTGRGMKTLKEVPIKHVARDLCLPIHEISDFRGWNVKTILPLSLLLESKLTSHELPVTASSPPPNLIVAVSFGILIPAHIITAALYGGINVHPSLLPMYRGSAPIYHTLLNGTPIAGVTIQTLHLKEFDKGTMLLQTFPPIEVPKRTSYRMLHDVLAVQGAEMLVETCRQRLFVPPLQSVVNEYKPSKAPRILAMHFRVDWRTLTAEDIERKCGALSTVWCRFGLRDETQLVRNRRVILSDITTLDVSEDNIAGDKVPPGSFQYLRMKKDELEEEEMLAIKCRPGGGWVRVGGIKMEGKRLVNGGEWARSARDQVMMFV